MASATASDDDDVDATAADGDDMGKPAKMPRGCKI